MSVSISPVHATHLLCAAYGHPGFTLPPLKVHRRPKYAHSYFIQSDILVIPGVNEDFDKQSIVYGLSHRYGRDRGWNAVNETIANTRWLEFVIRYCFEIARVFAPERPRLIVGHSLGACCAQLLAHHWDCPAITFATPAVFSRLGPDLPDRMDTLCINTQGDWLPAIMGGGHNLRRFGIVKTIALAQAATGDPHEMRTYRDAVHSQSHLLPKLWPA